jgi:hypothetical protein
MNAKIESLKIENAVMLIFTEHGWGNRKKADLSKIETTADKRLLSVTKKLIDSDAYRGVERYMREVSKWINQMSVPAFYLKGAYLFNRDFVSEVEEYLDNAKTVLREKVNYLIEEYEEKVEQARETLADQWNVNDYPNPQRLESSFRFSHRWIEIGVPQTLPKEIFQKEKEKAEKRWSDAAEQISLALRKSFIELIAHANRILQTDENGKTKGFKNSSFDNIDQFISTFKNRNIVGDKELEELVKKAEQVLVGVNDPQELKIDEELRDFVKGNFSEIEDKLSEMIETRPSRRFYFED